MHNEYRIKEVSILLKIGTETVFYPQVKNITTEQTGYFWWKKITEKVDWLNLYRETEGVHKGQIFTKDTYNSRELIHCISKDLAERVIREYEVMLEQNTWNYWRNKGVDYFTDEKLIKIHAVESTMEDKK